MGGVIMVAINAIYDGNNFKPLDPVPVGGICGGRVVVIPADDYSAIMETLYLKSVDGLKESLDAADGEPLSAWVPEEEVCW
jgi:predicted DNA-binding antitoxin AbrB/MazE fold protein